VKEAVTSFQSPSPTYASPSRSGSISLWAGQQLPTQPEHHTEEHSDDEEVIISSNLDDMLSVSGLSFIVLFCLILLFFSQYTAPTKSAPSSRGIAASSFSPTNRGAPLPTYNQVPPPPAYTEASASPKRGSDAAPSPLLNQSLSPTRSSGADLDALGVSPKQVVSDNSPNRRVSAPTIPWYYF
jgi:hypothetical protein